MKNDPTMSMHALLYWFPFIAMSMHALLYWFPFIATSMHALLYWFPYIAMSMHALLYWFPFIATSMHAFLCWFPYIAISILWTSHLNFSHLQTFVCTENITGLRFAIYKNNLSPVYQSVYFKVWNESDVILVVPALVWRIVRLLTYLVTLLYNIMMSILCITWWRQYFV